MITEDRTLVQFLFTLDSSLEEWGVYVNPEDPINDWRMGFNEFNYGNRIYIGSLKSLSFAQDPNELLLSALHKKYGRAIGWIVYKETQVLINVAKMIELFNDTNSKLCFHFRQAIKDEVSILADEWKLKDINAFIEFKLPTIISEHNNARTAIAYQ